MERDPEINNALKNWFDHRLLKECHDRIQEKNIKSIAGTFKQNIQNISANDSLPALFMTINEYELREAHYSFLDMIDTVMPPTNDSELQKKDKENRKARVATKLMDESTSILQNAFNKLYHLNKTNTNVQEGLEILKLNTISNTWTVFEAMTRDLWVTLLNCYPEKFFALAVDRMNTSNDAVQGLENRSISIKLLSKYNFNLRDNLGDVLVDKFDFTSVSGIHKAFSSFGRSKTDMDFLLNEHLTEMEIVRHLIVHNAGIVDSSFLRRTKLSAYSPEKGKRLNPSYYLSTAFCKAAVNSGVTLLDYFDGRIRD